MQEENPKQLFEDSSTVFPIESILNINEPKITSYAHKEPIESSYSISEVDDDTNFESINPTARPLLATIRATSPRTIIPSPI